MALPSSEWAGTTMSRYPGSEGNQGSEHGIRRNPGFDWLAPGTLIPSGDPSSGEELREVCNPEDGLDISVRRSFGLCTAGHEGALGPRVVPLTSAQVTGRQARSGRRPGRLEYGVSGSACSRQDRRVSAAREGAPGDPVLLRCDRGA